MTPRIRIRGPLAAVAGILCGLSLLAAAEPNGERLTSRPRPTITPTKAAPIGEEVRTDIGQRRRLTLADGSVVYVNDGAEVKVTGERRLRVSKGQVFVDVAPAGKDVAAFTVTTPDRELTCDSGAFVAGIVPNRDNKPRTGVIVARGRVNVNGVDAPVRAGQKLPFDGDKIIPAQRVSSVAGWTRDLMAAAESPLVPASQYGGGALVAVDPDGQEAKLSLRKYHVDVHIEDGFARTTIDQTYFNDTASRLEGTFYFPLPPDASLSRLAMYVDGKRMEGGMVERDFGRQVYDRIVTSQRDPALLEWVDGSTFKMRVFPLEARQEKRVILSYVQKMPSLYEQMEYRFPAGHSLEAVRDWSFQARVKGGADYAWNSPSHRLDAKKDGGDLLLNAAEKNVKVNRDVVLTLSDPAAPQDEAVRFSSFEQDGQKYLMLRYRPALDAGEQRTESRNWVFLFESSGDRDPLLARTQIEIIRGLLANAEPDDTFAVLAAGTRVRAFADKPQPVTPENVQKALAFLEGSHLIGALDLGRALTEAGPFLKGGKNAHLVHVGSGVAAMGERRDDVLAKRLPEGTRYVGVGVGRRWNRNFMKQAAERSGGYFTQINPDESVSWRAFDLSATLNTPRLLDVTVADKADKASFLTFTSLAAQGEEVCAVARSGAALPETVTVRGRLNGAAFARDIPVKGITENVGHLPRTWARLEIERLLADDALKNKDAIVNLSKTMYVMTPFTSLMVLENEEMYEQYKVDRGRKDHWAMYDCPEKIDVVYEPLEGMPPDPKKMGKPSAKQVAATVLIHAENRNSAPDRPAFRGGFAGVPMGGFAGKKEPMFLHGANDAAAYGIWDGADSITLQRGNDPNIRKAIDRLIQARRDPYSPSGPQQDSFGGNGGTSTGLRMLSPSAVQDWSGERLSRMESARGLREYLINATTVYTGASYTLGAFGYDGRSQSPAKVGQILVAGTSVLRPTESEDGNALLYERPQLESSDRLFFDLVAYAPGMDSSRADLLAVIEAEAAPSTATKLGTIDDGARRLFEKAKPQGWQTVTFPASGEQSAFSITFDGSGRYVYERTLPPGIRERVVCDGKTLLHLYADLGLGARRSVSRFHRLDFARAVPWAVPEPNDLARGADLKLLSDRTVVLVPHGAGDRKDSDGKPIPFATIQYRFAEDGRLAERRIVEEPAKKVLYREVYGKDGSISVRDGDDKEVAVIKATLRDADPSLTLPARMPDTKGLVVLPLPYRDVATTRKMLGIEKKELNALTFDEALALLAAHFGAGDGGGALKVCQQSLFARDQKQLGLYVLLAACGQNLDGGNVDVLDEHLHEPLAQYLALHSSPVLRRHASQWAVGSGQWREGYLQHLALTHALYQRWSNSKALGTTDEKRQEERDRALEYVRRNKGTAFGWGLLCLMKDRADEDERNKKGVRDLHKALAEVWPLFAEVPGLAYAAEYEHARSLWKAGQHTEARQRFVDLYERTFQTGALPRLDSDFRMALVGEGPEVDRWADLMRKTAAKLVEQKHRPAVLRLAEQCRAVGDSSLATTLLTTAREGITDAKERREMMVAAIDFLMDVGEFADADRLLRPMLDDPELAKRGDLWRMAWRLAMERGQAARKYECLERALDAEYRSLPEVVNLERMREDYQELLRHYASLANALETLKMKPPEGFAANVVRTADRWRALDPTSDKACTLAGDILKTLGEQELAWDYQTTPVGRQPNESGPWVALAGEMRRTGELDLADRAFAAAFEADPTDAQILWDRAQTLRQAGKTTEAQKLYRQLAEGEWSPRFNWVRSQAKWQLEKR